jgi:FkbH-like protein
MLGRRGIIIAVCSKNDNANAIEAFESHPEMVLRLNDIACFVANWDDKVANLRRIAERLNIGLDSIVFVDDSPFERDVVRRELPMVAVPELPEDPAWYSRAIADAGYFEAVEITNEDLRRGEMYRANVEREASKVGATNLEDYLASLEMRLEHKPFDKTNLQRIVQLINKTNQFNLTTKRYTQEEVEGLIGAPDAITLQLRLFDRFGDNGIIAIIIARSVDSTSAALDTWLMSCRVLGRQVEQASLAVVVQEALRRRFTHLRGAYRATKKNAMVRDHYEKLGFRRENGRDDGETTWVLDLKEYSPIKTSIQVIEPSRDL